MQDNKHSAFGTALLVLVMLICSCTSASGPRRTGNSELSFDSFAGIRFIEVRREFETGLSFNQMGFQQKPEWVLNFLPDDSVKIYSPFEKRFLHYPIYFDHDSVFNTAREWFRLKQICRDSMVIQLLQVKDKKVLPDRSNVYMKFYSEQYLRRAGANPDKLKLPNQRDSLYIQKLCRRANSYPDNIDSCFAATSPALFKSAHPDIKVEKPELKKGPFDDFKLSDVYMHPAYNITVINAYKDFFYEFSVLISEKGIIRFGGLLTYAEDFEGRKAVLRGIIKVYLQPMLKITPGSTLGYPHNSLVMLKVKGIK